MPSLPSLPTQAFELNRHSFNPTDSSVERQSDRHLTRSSQEIVFALSDQGRLADLVPNILSYTLNLESSIQNDQNVISKYAKIYQGVTRSSNKEVDAHLIEVLHKLTCSTPSHLNFLLASRFDIQLSSLVKNVTDQLLCSQIFDLESSQENIKTLLQLSVQEGLDEVLGDVVSAKLDMALGLNEAHRPDHLESLKYLDQIRADFTQLESIIKKAECLIHLKIEKLVNPSHLIDQKQAIRSALQILGDREFSLKTRNALFTALHFESNSSRALIASLQQDQIFYFLAQYHPHEELHQQLEARLIRISENEFGLVQSDYLLELLTHIFGNPNISPHTQETVQSLVINSLLINPRLWDVNQMPALLFVLSNRGMLFKNVTVDLAAIQFDHAVREFDTMQPAAFASMLKNVDQLYQRFNQNRRLKIFIEILFFGSDQLPSHIPFFVGQSSSNRQLLQNLSTDFSISNILSDAIQRALN